MHVNHNITKESKIAKKVCTYKFSIFSAANCHRIGTKIMLRHSLFNQGANMQMIFSIYEYSLKLEKLMKIGNKGRGCTKNISYVLLET